VVDAPPTYLHRSAAPSGSQPPLGVGREAPLTAARRGAISLGRSAGRRSEDPCRGWTALWTGAWTSDPPPCRLGMGLKEHAGSRPRTHMMREISGGVCAWSAAGVLWLERERQGGGSGRTEAVRGVESEGSVVLREHGDVDRQRGGEASVGTGQGPGPGACAAGRSSRGANGRTGDAGDRDREDGDLSPGRCADRSRPVGALGPAALAAEPAARHPRRAALRLPRDARGEGLAGCRRPSPWISASAMAATAS